MRRFFLGLVAIAWFGLALAESSREIVLHVENMTCPACRITIEKALEKVPGVMAKHVDTQAAVVRITFDAERTDAAVIAKAVSESGFPATVKASAADD